MFTSTSDISIDVIARLFRGFGDPSRLAILSALLDQPLTVTEIVTTTGLSQSNVSNHLSCLRDCGLVISNQTWRQVTYRISDDRVCDLILTARTLLRDVATGVASCTRYDMDKERERG